MKRLLPIIALAAILGPGAAQADEIGPRAGISIDPDQFVFGGQLWFPFERDFRFAPSLEIGFGDNVTTIQPNLDFSYQFDVRENWNPYVGAGLGIVIYEWDGHWWHDRWVDDSDTELGVNLIGGLRFKLRRGSAVTTELRLGVGDIPDIKLVAGWNFPL